MQEFLKDYVTNLLESTMTEKQFNHYVENNLIDNIVNNLMENDYIWNMLDYEILIQTIKGE